MGREVVNDGAQNFVRMLSENRAMPVFFAFSSPVRAGWDLIPERFNDARVR
jgi:hypothetical protein